MPDVVLMFLIALGGSLAIAVPGVALLLRVRGRSVTSKPTAARSR